MSDEIEVEGPDGEVFAFPAGTSDAVMKTALIKFYQGQKRQTPAAPQPEAPGFVDEFGRSGLPSAEDRQAMGDTVGAGVRALANGATLGLADRFSAGMGALTGIGGTAGDYAGNLKQQQAATREAASSHPVASIAGEMIGGAALPLGAAGAAMKAASLPGKVAIGGAAGAAIGGAQGAISAPDLTDAGDVGKRALAGAEVGLGVGAGMPLVARGIGAGYRAVAERSAAGATPEVGRAATGELSRAVQADGPQAVETTLAGLGPQGMLADAGPSLTGVAQGVALKPGEAKSALVGALTKRDEGVNSRLQAEVNSALGPAESPVARTADVLAQRRADTGPMFRDAFDNAPLVDASAVVAAIGQSLNKARGPERAALQKAVQMLREDGPSGRTWVTDAETLHNVKVALDSIINYGDPGLGIAAGALSKAEGALKSVRGSLNDTLRRQVPGYAAANDASAALAREAGAIETGTSILDGGKTAVRPDDLAAKVAGMTPNELAGLRVGSRSEIDRAIGTKANDLVALKQTLQGEGGWNTQKLATVHGDDAARAVTDAVTREGRMRTTYDNVVRNSQTAQRTAAAKALGDTEGPSMPVSSLTTLGLVAAPLKAAATKAWSMAVRPDNTARDTELARALSLQGPDAQGLLSALADAARRRAALEGAAQATGDRAAMASGLLGAAYLQHQLGKR